MGQQEHERGREPPLRAARRQELVQHHLRAVDEIPVLRFPDHQPARRLQVVAELEADRRALGQRAVVDLERRPGLRQPLQRDVSIAGDAVVVHGVAMAERAALDVFARQADRDAVFENRRERQILGGGPVHRRLVDGLHAPRDACRGCAPASCGS